MLLTDVTGGRAGNNERMAFLFDTRRVKPSGLACELVIPPERDDIVALSDARRRASILTLASRGEPRVGPPASGEPIALRAA